MAGLLAADGAGPLAVVAGFGAMDGDFLFDAEDSLLEFDGHVVAQVAAALNAGAAALAAHVEHFAEDIAEDVAHIALEWTAAGWSGATLKRSVAVAVVGGALFAIAEDGVGFRALFKLRLGLRIIRVAVGVELHCELAVCGLDLAVRGGLRYLQNLVIIDLGHVCGRHLSLPCLHLSAARSSPGAFDRFECIFSQ